MLRQTLAACMCSSLVQINTHFVLSVIAPCKINPMTVSLLLNICFIWGIESLQINKIKISPRVCIGPTLATKTKTPRCMHGGRQALNTVSSIPRDYKPFSLTHRRPNWFSTFSTDKPWSNNTFCFCLFVFWTSPEVTAWNPLYLILFKKCGEKASGTCYWNPS